MEYTIQEVGKMAGISTRTLRFYDEIGLLLPKRISTSGYRIYGKEELNRLQQILFYREFGLKLEEIQAILTQKTFDRTRALEEHRARLLEKRSRIDAMLSNLDESLEEMKGKVTMKDKDKFRGLKEEALKKNEEKYGKEIREKYGEKTVEESNRKFMNQSPEEMAYAEALSKRILDELYAAMDKKDPASPEAQQVAKLHEEWLMLYWPSYSKEAHRGLSEMYVADERFKAFYDKGREGAAEFLREIIAIYTA